MMRLLTISLAVAVAMALSACGDSDPNQSEKQSEPEVVGLAPVDFEGFMIPGNAETAKASGFTQCSDEYSNFVCTNSRKVVIFGIEADGASIRLNAADAFSESYFSNSTKITEANPSRLSYRSIQFAIPNVKYDPVCIKRYKRESDWLEPERCKTSGGKDTLAERLIAAGWYEGSVRRGTTYYKVGTPLSVYVKSSDVDGVSVTRMGKDESQAIWDQHASDKARRQQDEVKSKGFIDSMKTP